MSRSYQLLALVLVALGLVSAGYRWGATATNNALQAQLAKQQREAQDKFLAEVRRADRVVGHAQAALLAQAADYQQLDEAFHDYRKRGSLLARPLARGAAVPPASASAAHGQLPAADAAPEQGCANVVVPSDPALSRGAVWMWNSALTGHDAPEGTCGLADSSESACAADAGVTLDDAWRNQRTNARLCAEDRLRHRQLIDYINGAPPAGGKGVKEP